VHDFISEDDLETFEGWLRYQGFDAATLTSEELAEWCDIFDKARKDSLASPKVGLMKLRPVPGEHRYAVAVREGPDLWLTLWVRRSKRGEFFVMVISRQYKEPRKVVDDDTVVDEFELTTRAALENAASVALASPMSLSQSKTMLLGMCSKSCGAPGLIASLASVIAGTGSYSTSIASAASRAAVKVSATTNATG
jgi:hypothetical protein